MSEYYKEKNTDWECVSGNISAENLNLYTNIILAREDWPENYELNKLILKSSEEGVYYSHKYIINGESFSKRGMIMHKKAN